MVVGVLVFIDVATLTTWQILDPFYRETNLGVPVVSQVIFVPIFTRVFLPFFLSALSLFALSFLPFNFLCTCMCALIHSFLLLLCFACRVHLYCHLLHVLHLSLVSSFPLSCFSPLSSCTISLSDRMPASVSLPLKNRSKSKRPLWHTGYTS